MNVNKILSKNELAAVLSELHRKRRSRNSRMNAVLVRLAACCGLRVSEIVTLTLEDVRLEGSRPHLRIRRENAKRRKPRTVSLTWDGETLAAISAWRSERIAQGATGDAYFVCSQAKGKDGKALSRRNAQARWQRAMGILGSERARDVQGIHAGRHSFASIALAGGKSLVQVRDALGHSSIATTNVYLHAAEDEHVGSLFSV